MKFLYARVSSVGQNTDRQTLNEGDFDLVYIDKYGMQVFLFLLGFFSVFVLGHNAVKRAKAKF